MKYCTAIKALIANMGHIFIMSLFYDYAILDFSEYARQHMGMAVKFFLERKSNDCTGWKYQALGQKLFLNRTLLSLWNELGPTYRVLRTDFWTDN